MASGKVKWWDRRKGYGFIVGESGDDVFVHYTRIKGNGHRGLCEGFFRLRHLERTPLSYTAFGVSVAAEAALAAAASVRERDPAPLRGYLGGLAQAVRQAHRERRGQTP